MEILGSVILVCGVIDDLRSQKVHNALVLSLFALTLVTISILSGPSSLIFGFYGFALALLFTLPLFFAKVIGGGDVKLFAIFGLATTMNAVFHVAILSILWGALLGLVRSILSGQFKQLILSTTQLLWTKGEGQKQFKIPFTVALLFGWMTYLSLNQVGVLLW